jgi:hypothetical protein
VPAEPEAASTSTWTELGREAEKQAGTLAARHETVKADE